MDDEIKAAKLEVLLPETDEFPTGKGIDVIRGKTLSKNDKWWKAMLLCKVGNKDYQQIRLYGWQKDKSGTWKVRQKFNISEYWAKDLGQVLDIFGS